MSLSSQGLVGGAESSETTRSQSLNRTSVMNLFL